MAEPDTPNTTSPRRPSMNGRGELEITDVNNHYIDEGQMGFRVLDGCLLRCEDV